jgi:hypothetical protein
MCAQALLSITCRTNPLVLLFLLCHNIRSDMARALNIYFNWGMKRKCFRTFFGNFDQPTSLYRVNPHFGQAFNFAYRPSRNNTHPFGHVWMIL